MKTISLMRRAAVLIPALLIAAALVFPSETFAASGGVSGPPTGKGRKPVDPGGIREGSIFGDPLVVVRNLTPEGDGSPIQFKWTWPANLYSPEGDLIIQEGDFPSSYAEVVTGGCVQPISNAPLTNASGTQYGVQFAYAGYIDSYGTSKTVFLVPLDDECKIPEAYAATWGEQVIEVDSGRLNLARTTQYVLDAAYEEALTTLNSAGNIGLDMAGRLLLLNPADGTAEKTVDAPRENLALYQRLMKDGCLSPATSGLALSAATATTLQSNNMGYLVCDVTLAQKAKTTEDLLRAASFLAGAADKFGRIGVDEVIYVNSALGINQVTVQPDGSVFVTGYFDFGNITYMRSLDEGKTAKLLQPPTTEDAFDTDGYPLHFDVVQTSVYNKVFSGGWDGTSLYLPVVNFTRAADDSLAVIYYIHNYELPVIVEKVP